MLKIGLIGAGMIGRVHAEAYSSVKGFALTGVVDSNPEAAQKLAQSTGIQAYSSVEELVEQENPDALDICLPTYLHKPFVLEAAKLGKHVFCEKPIAVLREDAQQMYEACRAAGVTFMVGHALRFSPDYIRAKQLVDEGKLGKIGTVRLIRESGMPGWASWFADPAKSGGVLLDMSIHDLDWLRWTFGEAERVYAKSLPRGEGMPGDHAIVSIRMKNGAIAHVTGSWAQPDGFRSFLELAGTDGVATLDSDEILSIRTAIRQGKETVHSSESPLHISAYTAELQHFVDCIVSGTEPLVNGEEATRSLELCLAAIRSAESGQVVTL
jgi:UDP-N-acetylglucosamine 3-dehydrogenase